MAQEYIDIAVAGGGPAGCAAAIGLRRMGYGVMLVHAPRAAAGFEGISARALDGMRRAGLHRAAAAVPCATRRLAHWGGTVSEAGTEHLLQRAVLDPLLREDAGAAGVTLLPGRVRSVTEAVGGGCVLQVESTADNRGQELRCRFFIEARGRAAPGADKAESVRGPPGVSLLQCFQGIRGGPLSLVAGLSDGWLWYADAGHGTATLQLTLSATRPDLPARAELETWFRDRLPTLDAVAGYLAGSTPVGGVHARGSASVLQGGLVGKAALRIGDAAMAVDPLSGNGIFQALSSAMSAPAVVNTLLQRPGDAPLARRFHEDRVRQLFLQFARTGRDFYRIEGERRSDVFWRERSDWPDAEPVHDSDPVFVGIETRPVLANGFIHEAPVAITSDRPLGVWHVAGVSLAELLADLPAEPESRAAILSARLHSRGDSRHPRRRALAAWLARYRLVPPDPGELSPVTS